MLYDKNQCRRICYICTVSKTFTICIALPLLLFQDGLWGLLLMFALLKWVWGWRQLKNNCTLLLFLLYPQFSQFLPHFLHCYFKNNGGGRGWLDSYPQNKTYGDCSYPDFMHVSISALLSFSKFQLPLPYFLSLEFLPVLRVRRIQLFLYFPLSLKFLQLPRYWRIPKFFLIPIPFLFLSPSLS